MIEREPILTPVKDRLYGGVFSSLDTNGNIHQFCCQLKKILVEKYHVQFFFKQEIEDFLVSTTARNENGVQQRHVTGLQTTAGRIVDQIDNVVLTNGNDVMPLMKKLKIYIPVYPVKVFHYTD